MNRTQVDIRLRRACAADAAGLTGLVEGLSVHSRFFRFLSGIRSPSAPLVTRMLRRDATHGAWLAVAGDQPVGHVMWTVVDGVADVGVLVSDAWQRQGIGGRLMQTALSEAAVAGAGEVRVDVHSDNGQVIALLRRTLPGARVTREAELLAFQAPLRLAVPAPPPARRQVLNASGVERVLGAL
jgi:ribosomal protein S18 acetylase RimI-like enzyme